MDTQKILKAIYATYEPTVEDLLAIQDFFDAERAVAAKTKTDREINETDTRSECTLPPTFTILPKWDAPSDPMSDAFNAVPDSGSSKGEA